MSNLTYYPSLNNLENMNFLQGEDGSNDIRRTVDTSTNGL